MLRIALEYDVDLSLLDDLIVVRRVLEREMARAAAGRLTDDELAALAENLDEMEASYDDYDRFRALDNALPRDRDEGLRQRGRPARSCASIHRHGGVTPLRSRRVPARRARSGRSRITAAIYEALAARDGELAGERISEHIDSAPGPSEKGAPRAASLARHASGRPNT